MPPTNLLEAAFPFAVAEALPLDSVPDFLAVVVAVVELSVVVVASTLATVLVDVEETDKVEVLEL
jgi:hypothetical protein